MKLPTRTMACLILSFLCITPTLAGETKLKVGLLSGGGADNQFWSSLVHFAQAVADDLSIDLEVLYPPSYLKSGKDIKITGGKALEEIGPGAYMVMPYLGSATAELLQSAGQRDNKIFIINIDILEKERANLGQPRGKYSNWIAHSYANDVQAGYIAADQILSHFPSTPSQDGRATVRMVGLTGPFTVQASFDRNNGLKERIRKSENAMLYEIKEAGFKEASAYTATGNFLIKYPSLNAIWAANDSMAMGAIKALKEAHKKPGEDVIVAGIDWTQRGLDSVKSGELAATIGGHYIDAGMALILIYDYQHGKDFADELGTVFKTPMYPISKENINEYLNKIGTHPDWSKIDFKKFSKVYNPDLKKYNFSWHYLMQNIDK